MISVELGLYTSETLHEWWTTRGGSNDYGQFVTHEDEPIRTMGEFIACLKERQFQAMGEFIGTLNEDELREVFAGVQAQGGAGAFEDGLFSDSDSDSELELTDGSESEEDEEE
jgi:hypothetical protein